MFEISGANRQTERNHSFLIAQNCVKTLTQNAYSLTNCNEKY